MEYIKQSGKIPSEINLLQMYVNGEHTQGVTGGTDQTSGECSLC